MTTSIAGICDQLSTMHRPVTANAQTANGSEVSSSDSASISANDFLTLLVTEMKNQDPTANTDPNEYINQLVQVNSLQQLISINQTLAADSAVSANVTAGSNHDTRAFPGGPEALKQPIEPHAVSHALDIPAVRSVSGNLTIPATSSAAIRVAQALGRN